MKVLFKEGLPYFIEDLRSIKGFNCVTLGSLTEAYLGSKGVTVDSGKVVVRPAGLGVDSDGTEVDAGTRFDGVWVACAIVVGAPQIFPGRRG